MWTPLAVSDHEKIDRFAEIMRSMDRRYERLSGPYLRSRVRTQQCRLELFESDVHEIALMFYHEQRHQRWLLCLGYKGSGSLTDAYAQIVAETKRFMADRGIASIHAVKAKNIADPSLRQIHAMPASDANLRVEVLDDSSDIDLVRLSFVNAEVGASA